MSRTTALAAALWVAACHGPVAPSHSGPPPPPNTIQIENDKPGTSAWQLTDPATGGEIEGYAGLTSVNRGDAISLFVNTAAPSYTLTIFRLGWYSSAGGRLVQDAVTLSGQVQPSCPADAQTGLVDCNWNESYALSVPANAADPTDWTSGVYMALLTASTGKQAYIIFVVRDDARPATYLFQSSVTTYQAYNEWGGQSLYRGTGGHARKVSFNRPYGFQPSNGTWTGGAGEFLPRLTTGMLGWEYSMVRFLEREGYDVAYATDVDTHANGALLLNHRAFLSVGHDEYWSWEMRAHVEAARDSGVNLGFFVANSCYWQIRLEPSTASGTADRIIVGYKEFALDEDPDCSNPARQSFCTVNWRDAPVSRPEAALLGVQFEYIGCSPPDIPFVVNDPAHFAFAGMDVRAGDEIPGAVSYEADAVGAASPANIEIVAASPACGGTSHATSYVAPSGAMVFATGTFAWAWLLDDYGVSLGRGATYDAYANAEAQQMTRNVLTRLGQ